MKATRQNIKSKVLLLILLSFFISLTALAYDGYTEHWLQMSGNGEGSFRISNTFFTGDGSPDQIAQGMKNRLEMLKKVEATNKFKIEISASLSGDKKEILVDFSNNKNKSKAIAKAMRELDSWMEVQQKIPGNKINAGHISFPGVRAKSARMLHLFNEVVEILEKQRYYDEKRIAAFRRVTKRFHQHFPNAHHKIPATTDLYKNADGISRVRFVYPKRYASKKAVASTVKRSLGKVMMALPVTTITLGLALTVGSATSKAESANRVLIGDAPIKSAAEPIFDAAELLRHSSKKKAP